MAGFIHTHLLSHNFFRSGISAWLRWVLCFTRLQSRYSAGVSSEALTGEGSACKLMWLSTGVKSLNCPMKALAICWLSVRDHPYFLVTWVYPHGNVLHQNQQWSQKSEPATKMEVITFYNIIMKTTSYHLYDILLVRIKSQVLSTIKASGSKYNEAGQPS